MAFVALFGWIFLLLIPIVYIATALETVLTWVVAHLFFVNIIVGVLLALAQRLKEIDGGEEEDAKKY